MWTWMPEAINADAALCRNVCRLAPSKPDRPAIRETTAPHSSAQLAFQTALKTLDRDGRATDARQALPAAQPPARSDAAEESPKQVKAAKRTAATSPSSVG